MIKVLNYLFVSTRTKLFEYCLDNKVQDMCKVIHLTCKAPEPYCLTAERYWIKVIIIFLKKAIIEVNTKRIIIPYVITSNSNQILIEIISLEGTEYNLSKILSGIRPLDFNELDTVLVTRETTIKPSNIDCKYRFVVLTCPGV